MYTITTANKRKKKHTLSTSNRDDTYPFHIQFFAINPIVNSTPIDCLIAEFLKQNGISYLCVTHNVQYGFVTYKKEKKAQPIIEDEESEYISVYSNEILT